MHMVLAQYMQGRYPAGLQCWHGSDSCHTHSVMHRRNAFTTALVLQVPKCASVAVAAYSFPEKFSSFSFLSLLTKAEVIAALVKVRAECNKVGGS